MVLTLGRTTKLNLYKREEKKRESQMIIASIEVHRHLDRRRCIEQPGIEDFVYRLNECKILTRDSNS